jgi:hypothetical protein
MNVLDRVHDQFHGKQPNENYNQIHRIYSKLFLQIVYLFRIYYTYRSILQLNQNVLFHRLERKREQEYRLPHQKDNHHHVHLLKN